MSPLNVAPAFVLAILATACGSDRDPYQSPTGPTPPTPVAAQPSPSPRPMPTPTPTPKPQPGPPNAVLVISKFTAHGPAGSRYPHIVLKVRETGGRSGAYVLPVLNFPGGGVDYGCDGFSFIEPHGTWETQLRPFLCLDAPIWEAAQFPEPGMVAVVVLFMDEEGHEGRLDATTKVEP